MSDNEFPDDDHPFLGDGDADALEEAYMVWLMWMTNENVGRRYPMPQHNIGLRGDQYIQGVLNGNPRTCVEMFRMEVTAFEYICQVLRDTLIMEPTERTELEESLAIFCLIVGHGQGQRVVADRFQHSTKTINRHVKTVTRALHELGRSLIRPTHIVGIHPYIASNRHNYPWFQNCLGAMDGTMISAAAPAHLGYYYLVDVAFPCIEMFMPPYPRERYHRSDHYNKDGFRGYKDYFNYRHSSLRNVIERTFSLLKRRFRILYAMPPYRPVRQGMIITACCTLHNMIKTVTPNDEIIQGISNHRSEMQNSSTENESKETSPVVDMSSESAQAMGAMRDAIALPMWAHRFGQ
ncbi:uncharacterized protein LOC122310212 [Carya illinoinensis]|uniref:uncharacterized protein LOC122310212 n=1 Tax=Carya illinoinensis TaxID=32201 RepID=UPI001C71A5C5|nr:uncharacterized protein LOC122310212 [Carya illinoinensis]